MQGIFYTSWSKQIMLKAGLKAGGLRVSGGGGGGGGGVGGEVGGRAGNEGEGNLGHSDCKEAIAMMSRWCHNDVTTMSFLCLLWPTASTREKGEMWRMMEGAKKKDEKGEKKKIQVAMWKKFTSAVIPYASSKGRKITVSHSYTSFSGEKKSE